MLKEWIKTDKNTFPKGKCLVIFLVPSFGGYSLEITTAYFDNPEDYEDEEGRGWLDWCTDKEIKVTHFMELPAIDFNLIETEQKNFLNKFSDKMEFGIVPDEAIVKFKN